MIKLKENMCSFDKVFFSIKNCIVKNKFSFKSSTTVKLESVLGFFDI